jgi:His/Glu/Gln/Arg/opine family amino acid ABC transporter permease subunit
MYFSIEHFTGSFPRILNAVPVALAITAVGFFAGLILGAIAALFKIYKVPVMRHLVSVYISFFRGTPLLVQLFVAYYGLPLFMRYLSDQYGIGIDFRSIPALYFAFVVYALNTGAYLTETIRGAIEAVDKGQYDAAKSIGMTGWQMMRRIVLPQAFLVALPNLGNTVIALIKDTSLAFSITIMEIIGTARIISSNNSRYLEAFVAAAFIYWPICIIFEIITRYSEKWSKRRRGLDDNVKGNT